MAQRAPLRQSVLRCAAALLALASAAHSQSAGGSTTCSSCLASNANVWCLGKGGCYTPADAYSQCTSFACAATGSADIKALYSDIQGSCTVPASCSSSSGSGSSAACSGSSCTTCATCVASSGAWCFDTKRCGSVSDYVIYGGCGNNAILPSACTSGGSSGLGLTLPSLNLGVDGVESAKQSATAGTAASVALGLALGGLLVGSATLVPCKTPAQPRTTEPWKPRAGSATLPLMIGIVAGALGLVMGIAAPVIPWFSIGLSASFSDYLGTGGSVAGGIVFSPLTITYTDITGAKVTLTNAPALPGAAIAYAALALFVLPALAMATGALCRLNALLNFASPPPVQGCCLPSLPAVQGCGWFGMILFLVGAIYDFLLFGLIRLVVFSTGVGPGGNLMAAAVALLFISNVCFSVAGCCRVGHLPGIGRGSKSCCTVERDAELVPAQAAAGSSKGATAKAGAATPAKMKSNPLAAAKGKGKGKGGGK